MTTWSATPEPTAGPPAAEPPTERSAEPPRDAPPRRPRRSVGSNGRPTRLASPNGSSRSADHSAVRTRTPPAIRSRPVTRVDSWIVTPRSRATRLRPRHSLAGSIITLCSGPARTPACQSGEWTSARTASRSRKTSRSPRSFSSSTPARNSATWWGRSATVRVPVSSRSQSILFAGEVDELAQVLRPSRSELHLAGVVALPLARPWVRLASQNPPFRPLAEPDERCSSRTIRSDESVSARRIAVHSPVNPPPTMTTSARASPRSGGSGSAARRPASS